MKVFQKMKPEDVKKKIKEFGGVNDRFVAWLAQGTENVVKDQVIERLNTGYLVDTKILKKGEVSRINAEEGKKVVIVAPDGRPFKHTVQHKELTIPERKIEGIYEFDISDLEQGFIRAITDQTKDADELVRSGVEKAVLQSALLAVPSANQITGVEKFDEDIAAEAAGIITDIPKDLGSIYMTSSRALKDLKGWNLSDTMKDELKRKNVVGEIFGAKLCRTSMIPKTNILFGSEEFVGACHITYLAVKEYKGCAAGNIGLHVKALFKTAITKPEQLVLVALTQD